MTRYAAMLRGINVSGRNRLPMDRLRTMVENAGGSDVETYIQSGNAVFTSRRSEAAVVKALEAELAGAFDATVPVLVRSAADLAAVVGANPFLGRRGTDPGMLHVTFLGAAPTPAAEAVVVARKASPDELAVVGRQVYLRCPQGYGRTKLTNTYLQTTLGGPATTRNWKTVVTLLSMAGGGAKH
ncbi:MAG: DUF1697 domain-containing protein [Acidimicrobiales bacterium]